MRHWQPPIPLSGIIEAEIPDGPGVYVLLEQETDPSSVLKISSARSLFRAYKLEFDERHGHRSHSPRGFVFFETSSEAREADKFLSEFKRQRGFLPPLNSPVV